MTRENLAHFGYDGGVELADSRTHIQTADAVVTDLPYGNAIESDEYAIRAILEQSAGQARQACLSDQRISRRGWFLPGTPTSKCTPYSNVGASRAGFT